MGAGCYSAAKVLLGLNKSSLCWPRVQDVGCLFGDMFACEALLNASKQGSSILCHLGKTLLCYRAKTYTMVQNISRSALMEDKEKKLNILQAVSFPGDRE